MIYFLTLALLVTAHSYWVDAYNSRDTIRRMWTTGKYEPVLSAALTITSLCVAGYSLAVIYAMWQVHLHFDLDAIIAEAVNAGA